MNQQDVARRAAVENAFGRIEPGMTVGLGSGRAVFALAQLIGERGLADIRAVVASPKTAQLASEANIEIIDLDEHTAIDIAFDGADEIDTRFAMIKGGGAALLTEKLVLAAARHVVIMVEENKLVDHLGDTHTLPVEVVRFGWQTTRQRLLALVDRADLRMEAGQPVTSPQDHYLLDLSVPRRPLADLADAIKLTLGVIEHGLFLDQADEVLVGQADGTIRILSRPQS